MEWNRYVEPEVTVTVEGMDQTMSQTTRHEVLKKLRRRYQSAGPEHKRKLLDQAQEVLGYHRKAAIRSLRSPTVERGPRIISGRPMTYRPEVLLPYLRPIWQATDYACGRRLVAMLPEYGLGQRIQTKGQARAMGKNVVHMYNTRRPHGSLNMDFPERFTMEGNV